VRSLAALLCATTLLAVGAVPASSVVSNTADTSSCIDGGGHRWSGRSLWRSEYTDGDGSKLVHLSRVGFTSTAPDATTVDYTVKVYDGAGALLQSLGGSNRLFNFRKGSAYLSVNPRNPPSSPGRAKVMISVGAGNDGFGNCTMTFVQTEPDPDLRPSGASITHRPTQAASLVYGATGGTRAYAHPGALVVAGRDNYSDQAFENVSAAGGTVLVYLDAIIDNPHGRYHRMLNKSSKCGPATSPWPGNYKANSWGRLNDFRVGSVLQRKFKCVLEKVVQENPHIGGFFADDLGSRSWFPGINWSRFPDKAGYRAGAIHLTQTLRTVANQHGLIFLVNGTWAANDGGGYPDPTKSGNALADGGFVEHHDGEIRYFGPYGCSNQWAAQSPVTKGRAVNYAVTYTTVGRAEYINSRCFAYVNRQSKYDTVPPWGRFYGTGLPSRVVR